MNHITIIGNLTRDPELRTTQGGTSVCTFTVACQRPVKKGQGDQEADFIRCVAWRERGEFISRYFHKGSKIALEGRLQVRSYEAEDGAKRTIAEVVVDSVEFVERRQGSAEPTQAQEEGFTQEPQDDLPF